LHFALLLVGGRIVVNTKAAQITTVLLLALSLFLMGMDGTGTGDGGQDGLAARQRELHARIETLKSEQELLLFQKQFSTMNSKYLVLDPARGRGQLKYRSRVLLDFTFKSLPKGAILNLPRGARAVTKKIEKVAEGKFALVFGPTFVLRTKSSAAPGRGAPQLIVAPREMRSIFFALEEGSMAYVLR
jgi:hypothetical protein